MRLADRHACEFSRRAGLSFRRRAGKIRGEIPYDAAGVPPMSSFCHSTEAGPLDIPLHPGAERYYREHGYL